MPIKKDNPTSPYINRLKEILIAYYALGGVRKKKYRNLRPWSVLSRKIHKNYDRVFQEFLTGKNVLDVGCSEGFFTFWISLYSNTAIGIDLSKANNKNKIVKQFGINNLSFMDMNAFDITSEFLTNHNIEAIWYHKVEPALGRASIGKLIRFWEIIVSSPSVKIIMGNSGPPLAMLDWVEHDLGYSFLHRVKGKNGPPFAIFTREKL